MAAVRVRKPSTGAFWGGFREVVWCQLTFALEWVKHLFDKIEI